MDFNNECSKKSAIDYKYTELFGFNQVHEDCYFIFIQSLILLNKYFEEKNSDLLYNIFENLSSILVFSNDIIETKRRIQKWITKELVL
jgi:hypothetical protein